MIDVGFLLSQIEHITRKHQEIARITGENFNIFNLLGVSTSEVRLHSAFLAELLNPKGSHDLGTVFIEEFVAILKQRYTAKIDYDPARARRTVVEHWLGSKTPEGGGYIDIWLEDDAGKHIVIENKIYAGDQEDQLLRYHAADRNAPLVYLTLDGREPSGRSTKGHQEVRERTILLSYRDDIVEWLEACRRHAVSHSLLRETISQYLNLVKQLTHQSMSKQMEQEIVRLITSDPARLKAALEVTKSIDAVKNALLDRLSEQLDALEKNSGSEIRRYPTRRFGLGRWQGISYGSDFLDPLNLSISYQSQAEGLRDFIDGISWTSTDCEKPRDIYQKVAENARANSVPGKVSDWWVIYWNRGTWTDEIFGKILDGSLAKELFARFQEIHEFAKAALGESEQDPSSGRITADAVKTSVLVP